MCRYNAFSLITLNQGKSMTLADIDAVIMDMDGVLWRGDKPLPGLIPFFDRLRARDIPFALATNNSSKSQADYVTKLAGMGVLDVPAAAIVTSATATATYLQQHYPAGTRVYIIGGDGLKQILTAAGFVRAVHDVQVVVAGIDFELSYAQLRQATLLIRSGADFIGTNPDRTFPTPEGEVPGAGSILAALSAATDRLPVVIGKPNRTMFEAALALLGTAADRTLMIGDRLETDILGARNAGLKTALVLTGIATREQVANSDIKPDGIFAGLPELMAAWD